VLGNPQTVFKKKNLPPLVPTLPLVGSIPFLGKQPEKAFSKWASKYGPVIRVRIGSLETVVLSSPSAIH